MQLTTRSTSQARVRLRRAAAMDFDHFIDDAQLLEPAGMHLENAEPFECTHGRERSSRHAMAMHFPVARAMTQEMRASRRIEITPEVRQLRANAAIASRQSPPAAAIHLPGCAGLA